MLLPVEYIADSYSFYFINDSDIVTSGDFSSIGIAKANPKNGSTDFFAYNIKNKTLEHIYSFPIPLFPLNATIPAFDTGMGTVFLPNVLSYFQYLESKGVTLFDLLPFSIQPALLLQDPATILETAIGIDYSAAVNVARLIAFYEFFDIIAINIIRFPSRILILPNFSLAFAYNFSIPIISRLPTTSLQYITNYFYNSYRMLYMEGQLNYLTIKELPQLYTSNIDQYVKIPQNSGNPDLCMVRSIYFPLSLYFKYLNVPICSQASECSSSSILGIKNTTDFHYLTHIRYINAVKSKFSIDTSLPLQGNCLNLLSPLSKYDDLLSKFISSPREFIINSINQALGTDYDIYIDNNTIVFPIYTPNSLNFFELKIPIPGGEAM